jgi:hypothetical protein
MTGSIILTEDNLSLNGVFNASLVSPPFNRLSMNLRGLSLQGRRIGLKKLSLYYSWPNVRLGTTATISWPNGSSFDDYVWTLPPLTNYQSVTVLNQSLQSFCIANGLYLINDAGDNVYFVELESNETTYKVDLNLFKVPTNLEVGYAPPSNFAGYPTTSVTPTFTIEAGSELSSLIGFDANTYDGGSTATSFESNFVPQLSPVSAIFVTCNVAKNDVPINGSTVIQVFTTRGTDYGSLIEIQPNEVTYYEIDNNSNTLEIQLFDQVFNPLYIQDPQIIAHLEVS